MKQTAFGTFACAMLAVSGAAAAVDLSEQEPIEVNVALGSAGGALRFIPSDITFEAGKLYIVVLKNPSPAKHYFSPPGFAASVWTRKIEVGNTEIKGDVREIELKPGGEAEWFFVPVKAGTYELRCTIPGHAEAGMVGKLTVR